MERNMKEGWVTPTAYSRKEEALLGLGPAPGELVYVEVGAALKASHVTVLPEWLCENQ